MAKTVEQDIADSKRTQTVCISYIDEKVVADFSVSSKTNGYDYGSWVNYKKVFDTWEEFTKYAKDFFEE